MAELTRIRWLVCGFACGWGVGRIWVRILG